MKCPYCSRESKMEAQTKELENTLRIWKKGEFIGTDKYNKLKCTSQCCSDECMGFVLKKRGYRSGVGRVFHVNIFLDNGIVNGNYEIISEFLKYEDKFNK